ncbi:MAG: PDZ domain-containing protein [Planctomycetota bacterium]
MKLRALLILFTILAGVARADTIHTRSGEVLKGRIVSQTKKAITIRSRYGSLTIPRSDIKKHVPATYLIEFKGGETVQGHIVGETEAELSVEVDGETRTIEQARITAVAQKETEPEPEPKTLSRRQIQAIHKRVLAYFAKKEYRKAIAECAKILTADPDNAIALYNTACGHSMLKEKEKALEFLRKSLEAGYVDFAHMKQDTDLDNIRDEPGYQALIEKKADYVRKSTEKAVGQIAEAMKKRGVDVTKYKKVFDRDRNFAYLHTRSDEELAVIRKGLEDYAEFQWEHLFQNRPTRPLYIVLLTGRDARKVFGGRVGGVYSSSANALFCGDIPTYKLMKTSVIVHEFTHALHFADMIARGQRHPIWLIEGLATLFESSDRNGSVRPKHSHRLAVVQAAVKADRSLPWKTFMKMNQAQFVRVARLAYAQSRYMLLYMYEKGLLKKFYDEYTDDENYKGDKTALEAFEVVFGTPIEAVERDWKAWVLKQKVPPIPYLGVQTLQKGKKLVVQKVMGGSPAAKAGIQKDDAFVRVAGRPVASLSQLTGAIAAHAVGDEVEIELARGDETVSVTVRLGKRKVRRVRFPREKGTPYLGLAVEEQDGGLSVRDVAGGSPAEKAGIQQGDALVRFGKKTLASVRDYLEALKKSRPGRTVRLTIRRGNEEKTVQVKLASQPED